LWKEVPVHFPVTIGSQTKNNKVYKKHIQPLYGSKDIRDITQLDVQQTLNHVATYCVQQTVRNVKTDWHRIFQVAQINKIAVMDLTTLVKTPEAMKTTERSVKEENITAEDFDSFISFMNEYGGYLPNETERIYNRTILVYLMKVMRVSGIRLQEARALSRNDITIEEETGHNSENDQENIQEYALIHIRHSAGTTYDNDNAIRKTKTKWSVRSVPVFDEGLIWIKEVLEYSKHELIFAKYSGEPFTSTEVADYVRRVKKKWKKVSGKDVDIYTTLMRKAYASDLYRDKVNQAAVKKLMGHKFESTSINWYAKSDDEEIKEAAKKRTYKKNKKV
ncbi:MAG: site-specific integrase, partial [Solobacterium sp.]|nr:site-specific integrase [Solobacterium sp.]